MKIDWETFWQKAYAALKFIAFIGVAIAVSIYLTDSVFHAEKWRTVQAIADNDCRNRGGTVAGTEYNNNEWSYSCWTACTLVDDIRAYP